MAQRGASGYGDCRIMTGSEEAILIGFERVRHRDYAATGYWPCGASQSLKSSFDAQPLMALSPNEMYCLTIFHMYY
jgi:hypothetical protein